MFTASCRALLAAGLVGAATAALAVAEPDDPTGECEQSAAPPPAVDASEAPQPGQRAPRPLPLPEEPPGGALLGSCGVVEPPGANPPPKGPAPAWLVADLDTGGVLAASDPHGRYRPASTIKTLLAVVVLDSLDTGEKIALTDSDEAADQESAVKAIRSGEVHTVRELLESLLMVSSNGAANALARALGGQGAAVAKMNAAAASLGALDTRAATPSGLDAPGMSSSPYDLALIFRAGLRKPAFAAILGQKTAKGTGPPDQPLVNRDPLLSAYPGLIGGKTGFTDDAQYNFVGAAARSGRRLVVAVMNSPGGYPAQQASALLDWGFALEPGLGVGSLG